MCVCVCHANSALSIDLHFTTSFTDTISFIIVGVAIRGTVVRFMKITFSGCAFEISVCAVAIRAADIKLHFRDVLRLLDSNCDYCVFGMSA